MYIVWNVSWPEGKTWNSAQIWANSLQNELNVNKSAGIWTSWKQEFLQKQENLRPCTVHAEGGWYPQIYRGDPRPCIPPCVMASSAMGLKLGPLGFCHTRKNKHKTNVFKIFAPHAVFYAWLSSHSNHMTNLTNHGYFDYGKNLKTPNFSPMPG